MLILKKSKIIDLDWNLKQGFHSVIFIRERKTVKKLHFCYRLATFSINR